jgi:hypothetical protein
LRMVILGINDRKSARLMARWTEWQKQHLILGN